MHHGNTLFVQLRVDEEVTYVCLSGCTEPSPRSDLEAQECRERSIDQGNWNTGNEGEDPPAQLSNEQLTFGADPMSDRAY